MDCFLFLNNLVYLFVFGCPGSSLLCQLFSGCREPGCSLVVVHKLLIAAAFLVLEHRLLGKQVSVPVACGLGNFDSQVLECSQ